jgi:ELWxxDGT repeat protein
MRAEARQFLFSDNRAERDFGLAVFLLSLPSYSRLCGPSAREPPSEPIAMTRPSLAAARPRPRLETLEARLAPANSPVLIANVAPTGDSTPQSFAGLGDFVYFAAAGPTGDELWRTDGTTAGTTNVADLYPGSAGFSPNGSAPRNLTAVGDTLFFAANDGGGTGIELYKSDGTAAGTTRVKDIRVGANSSSPTMLTAVGDTLYFVATDATSGTELWKSDGTEAGTVLVAELTAGSGSTTFGWLREAGGKLFFAQVPAHLSGDPVRIYSVDPPGSTLTPVVTFAPASGADRVFAFVGTRLFYHGITGGNQDTLFVLDTAAPTPTPVPLLSIPTTGFVPSRFGELAAVGSRLFFTAASPVGYEPWLTDGTVAGTRMVKDINQDTPQNNPGSDPNQFTDVGGVAYFAATTIASGREVWRSDGTEAGTWQVADVEPGDTSATPSELLSVGGHLVFDTTLNYVTTLRQYDPATGQLTSFPGHGLIQTSPIGGFSYAHAVYRDVLYMATKGTAGVGLEPHKLEFDPSPPTITGFDDDTGAADGITADTTIHLTGTATPNITVRVYDQSSLLGSTSADANGQWEFTTNVLLDGAHPFVARAVNTNGTESADSLELTVTVDTAAPAAPAITGFSDNSGLPDDDVTNDSTPTLTGTAEAGATVRVLDGPTVLGETTAGIDGQWAFPAPFRTDGSHPFTARAIDGAGNTSADSSIRTIVIDTDPPAVPLITGYSDDGGLIGDGLTNDATPTLTGTAEVGSTVTISDGPTVLGAAPVGLDGTWQYPAPALADGPHSFTATASDVAGNPSPPSAPLALTIDTVRPTVTINQASGQADPTNTSPVVFAVTFSKPVTGFDETDVSLSGTVGGTLAATVAGSGTDYTVTVTGMTGDGTVIASIPAGAAVDVAGNSSTAATSTDDSVRFDVVAPTATIDQAAGQADPINAGPILFTVTFSEPVTGFDATDVSFAGSTNPGSLVASVSGSGADYTVSVTGVSGAQTVVASIPAGAALDFAGNASAASTSNDNAVTFNDIGTLQFGVSTFETPEDGGTALITVTRTNGGNRAISIDYATGDDTAFSVSDYLPTTGTLHWADGDTTAKTFTVPITDDGANEGKELLTLTLSNPTNDAILGPQAAAVLAILPSDGQGPGAFTDADGDLVTVKLSPKTGAGSLLVYLADADGDGQGPIELVQLNGTTIKSAVSVTVKKPKGGTGDRRVELGTVTGGELKSLSAKAADLTGDGVQLTGYLGWLTIGNVLNGADIIAGGTAAQKTTIAAGTVGDGSTIQLGSVLSKLTAAAFGNGSVAAPSAGTISIKGDLGSPITLSGAGVVPGKNVLGTLSVGGSIRAGADVTAAKVGTIKIKQDLVGDLTISGAGVPTGKPALSMLSVTGAVRDSLVRVGGNVSSVTAGSFIDSRLFAGYDGTAFNVPTVVNSFTVTGKTAAFDNSYLFASTVKTVSLKSVAEDNDGTTFGIYADESIRSVTVTFPEKLKFPGLDHLGDFAVRIV